MELSIKIQTQITILKLIKLEPKKRRRRRAKLTHLSLGGEDMRWWEEKKGTHLTHLCVRERELLECSGVDEVPEKKRKKKSVETKC